MSTFDAKKREFETLSKQAKRLEQEVIQLRETRNAYWKAIDRAKDFIRNGLCERSYLTNEQVKTLTDLEERLRSLEAKGQV